MSTHRFRLFATASSLGTSLLLSALVLLPLPDDGGDHGHDSTRVYTAEDSTHGNLEGVAFDERSGHFFVGATGDGTIYRGSLDDSTLDVFVPGAAGESAVGMKVADGELYVAGGATGTLTVLDRHDGATLARFETGTDGFVNDLVVTEHGDVFLTDSFRPVLWRVTHAQVEAGSGTPESISVEPEIPFTPGAFNLNGIVSRDDRELIVVNSADGGLYRIEFGDGDDDGEHGDGDHGGAWDDGGDGDHSGHGHGGDDDFDPQDRRITRIDVEPLLGGDGLLLDHGRLLVVQGGLNALTLVDLHDHDSRGEIDERRTDPSLRGPSTVARGEDRYLIVNADFATSTTPFTVTGLER